MEDIWRIFLSYVLELLTVFVVCLCCMLAKYYIMSVAMRRRSNSDSGVEIGSTVHREEDPYSKDKVD